MEPASRPPSGRQRVWPASTSIVRARAKRSLLLHPEEVERVRCCRVLADMHPVEAMELLTTRLRKTKTNAEFLISMNMG